jgi:galactosamine-6-phosphate isomerase
MRVLVVKDYGSLSRRAEALVVHALRQKPRLLLGVATGASPAGLYERLAKRAQPSLFRRVTVVGLDEWLGLPRGHGGSCERYIHERILGPLGIPRSRYQGFRAQRRNREAETQRMSRWLEREGPLDLAILGLGRNGHLLMNEPAAALRPHAHVARLAESTRSHTMIQGLKTPPRQGLTLGMADILQSRAILLLVSGRPKRAALKRALQGPVSTRCPASFLRLHPEVTVVCDREAAPSVARRGRRS